MTVPETVCMSYTFTFIHRLIIIIVSHFTHVSKPRQSAITRCWKLYAKKIAIVMWNRQGSKVIAGSDSILRRMS